MGGKRKELSAVKTHQLKEGSLRAGFKVASCVFSCDMVGCHKNSVAEAPF